MTTQTSTPDLTDLSTLTRGAMAVVVNLDTLVFYRVQVTRVTATAIFVSWGRGELRFQRSTGRQVAQAKRFRLVTETDPRYATWLVGNEVARVMTKVAHQAGGVRITRDRADALRQLDLLSTLIDQARDALGR